MCCVLLSSAALTAQSQAPATGGQTGRDLVLEPDPKPDPPGDPGRPTPAGIPRGYALVVGVSQYKNLDPSKQLQFPETDAEAIYRILINREGGSFPAENVHLLKGPQATLVNIRRELEEWLPSVATPADRVIVFFAGHGLVKDGRGYLAPWDVDPDRLDTTAYPMSTLGEVLARKVKASWKVLLTDACHSGKINAETTNETLDQQFNSLPTNFLTLTATTEREQSYEDPKLSTGFGFFTYFLVQAWKGNADNDPCDGRVTADELIEYVRANVRRYAKDHNLTQTPTARGDYEPSMMLGVGTGCLTADNKDQPSMLGTAIIETTTDGVDLYIDGELVGKLSKDKPLTVPRLSSGLHEFKGVKAGLRTGSQGDHDRARSDVDRHAAHSIREAGEEGRARSECARREAAVVAAVVDLADDHDAGPHAERGRSQEGQGSVHARARRGPDLHAGGVQSGPGQPAAVRRGGQHRRLQTRDGERCEPRGVAHPVRGGPDRARRPGRGDPSAAGSPASRAEQRRRVCDARPRLLGQGRVGAEHRAGRQGDPDEGVECAGASLARGFDAAARGDRKRPVEAAHPGTRRRGKTTGSF